MVAEAGKGEARLRTNGTRFDDGRLHTVRIIRMHKQVAYSYHYNRVQRPKLEFSITQVIFYTSNFVISYKGKWVPRVDTRGVYPIFYIK